MAIEDLKKRLETFDSFPETKKVSLLYQQQIPLPTRDPYPENWERELVRAKDVARRKIQSSFPKNQARTPPVETADSDTDSDEDSQENFSLYDDDVSKRGDSGNGLWEQQQEGIVHYFHGRDQAALIFGKCVKMRAHHDVWIPRQPRHERRILFLSLFQQFHGHGGGAVA
jgi:hypothetical protein